MFQLSATVTQGC